MATRTAAADKAPAKGAKGRPSKKVYINVLVKETTRKALNTLTRKEGVTQGELLDKLIKGH